MIAGNTVLASSMKIEVAIYYEYSDRLY